MTTSKLAESDDRSQARNMSLIEWANETLINLGYQLVTPAPELILQTGWSEVYRFHTNQGFFYLKQVPPALSLEADVITLLEKQFQAQVPHIVATHSQGHCFIMKDAGTPLHEVFKQEFNAEILIDTMRHYTALQLQSASNIECFFKLGVPDWRMQCLPKRYQELLNEKELLLADGLTREEITQLHRLNEKLVSFCKKLATYNIPDTFGHADFHDKNILIHPQTQHTTVIDLGEVVITHPFFSFVNCLYRVTEHLQLTHQQYMQLQEACFKNWLVLESSERLFEIITIIEQCWSIHAVLGEYRLIKSVSPTASLQLSREGRLAGKLRVWME